MSFVSNKGVKPIQAPNQVQSSMNPDEYIDAFLKSQMTAPAKPYSITDKDNYDPSKGLSNIVGAYQGKENKGGDFLGASGQVIAELLNAKKANDENQANYEKSSDYSIKQGLESSNPYYKEAALNQYQSRTGNESAQAAAYNDLLKEQGKNALEGVKFKGQQEMDRAKLAQEASEGEKNRGVQFSGQAIDRDRIKKDTIEGLYNEAKGLGLKDRRAEAFVRAKLSGQGNAIQPGMAEYLANKAKSGIKGVMEALKSSSNPLYQANTRQ